MAQLGESGRGRRVVATLAVPRVEGLRALVASNGFIGALVGMPYVGDQLETQIAIAPGIEHPDEWAVIMLTFKMLTADEYDFATGVADMSRAFELAKGFLSAERHWSWPDRPSLLRR